MSAHLKEPIPTTSSGERPKPDAERSAGGQYARGNRGGPGNPFNRQIAAFRKMIVGTTTLDDVREATLKLIQAAREGNIAAIKLLFQYVVGKPLDAVDPDRVDIDEWKLCEQSNVGGEACQAVLIDGMPVRLATQLADIMEVSKYEKMKKQQAENEIRLAEETKITAAEDAAIERGIQESIRKHREEQAARPAAAAEERRTPTLEEILGIAVGPSANGGNGARHFRPAEFTIPTASEILIGGGAPAPNGDIGARDGSKTPPSGARRRQAPVAV